MEMDVNTASAFIEKKKKEKTLLRLLNNKLASFLTSYKFADEHKYKITILFRV